MDTKLVVFITILLLAIMWPFALIWALNTMFMLGINYTLQTWLAALVLSMTAGVFRNEKE